MRRLMERDRRNRELDEEERVIEKAQDERPYKCNIVFSLCCIAYGALLIYGMKGKKSTNQLSELSSGGGGIKNIGNDLNTSCYFDSSRTISNFISYIIAPALVSSLFGAIYFYNKEKTEFFEFNTL